MKSKLVPLLFCVSIFIFGCSGGHNGNPMEPGNGIISPQTSSDTDREIAQSNRYIWSAGTVEISADRNSIEVVPFRTGQLHLNAVYYMEVKPCTDCFKISNLQVVQPNTISLDLTIKHPFSQNLNLTAFDPRVILMTGVDYFFPVSERHMAWGDDFVKLMSPDGFTKLFNPVEYPYLGIPGLTSYFPGKYAKDGGLIATLNPFVAFAKDTPRRMFIPGSQETKTIMLHIPSGALHFGYAVDISWANPGKKVTDPETDFPPDANSIEPYRISVDALENLKAGIFNTIPLSVTVFDHQGKNTILAVRTESPDLITGAWPLVYSTSDGDGHTYLGSVTNSKLAGEGTYPLLIDVESTSPDSVFAYTVVPVDVVFTPENPVAMASFDPPAQLTDVAVHFFNDGSFDPDGGDIVKFEWDWDNDGIYDEEGPDVNHTWSAPGVYPVMMKVTDDEGATDELDQPLNAVIVNPVSLTDVTPEKLNLTPGYIYSDNSSLVIFSFGGRIEIFDITDPVNPAWIKTIPDMMLPSEKYAAVSDGYLYHLTNSQKLGIYDIDPPADAHEVKIVDLPGFCASVSVNGIYAYLGGGGSCITVIDIDPPEDAEVAGQIDLGGFVPGKMVFDNNFAYANEDGAGVGILELNPPDQGELKNSIYGVPFDLAIDNGYLFTAGGDGLNVYDVDPPETAHVTDYIINGSFYGLDIENGYLYSGNTGNTDQTDWYIYDIDPPEDPQLVTSLPLSRNVYVDTETVGDYSYVTDGVNSIRVIDVNPPESAEVINRIFGVGDQIGDMALDGNYAYIIDELGYLQIVDISLPESSSLLLTMPITGSPQAIAVRDGYAYVAAGEETMQVYDIDPPESSYFVTTLYYGGIASDIAIDGQYACVLLDKIAMVIFDLAIPDSPSVAGMIGSDGMWNLINARDGYAFAVAPNASGDMLSVIDIDPPSSPEIVVTVKLDSVSDQPGEGAIEFYDNYVCILYGSYQAYLNIVSIDPPENAALVDSLSCGNFPYGMCIDGALAYATGYFGLKIINIYPPDQMAIIYEDETITGHDQSIKDGYFYIADDGLRIYKMQ